MLRYRITCDPRGRYVVLAATTSVISLSEPFATRAEAQDTAASLNRLRRGQSDAASQSA